MSDTLRNWHITAISNTPGTSGDFVCTTAWTGFLTFGAADDGLSFTIVASDTAGRESRTGCVYTHSTRTLTRGTFDDSTTGGAIAFTSAAIVTATPLLASALAPLLANPQFANWFDVRGKYGGNIANAVAALNASAFGGVLYFSAGAPFTTAGNHVVTKRCALLGDGMADVVGLHWLSRIACTVNSVPVFDMQEDCWSAEGIDFTCSAANASSPAVAGSTAILGTKSWGSSVERCSFSWFFRCIDHVNAIGASHHGCHFIDWSQCAIRSRNVNIPDGGDSSVEGCIFQTINTTAQAPCMLEVTSSGGLRVINNKFNGFVACNIIVDIVSGINTVIGIITGNSFESARQQSIWITCAAGGSWSQWNIANNQFGHYGASGYSHIEITATTSGAVDRVNIANNQFQATGGGDGGGGGVPAVKLTNINDVAMGNNERLGFTKMVGLTNCTNVRNADAKFNVTVLTDGATITPDFSNSESNRVVLGGNRTLALPTTLHDGQRGMIRVKQDATGGRTLDTSAYKRPGGSLTITSAANAEDVLHLQRDNTDGTWILWAQQAFA